MRHRRLWLIVPLLLIALLALVRTDSGRAAAIGSPPPPAHPGASPALVGSVAYQINAAHDGNLPGSSLTPPLQQVWAATLSGLASYPLVTTDTVYLTARNPSAYGTQLYALDLQTGAIRWGPVPLGGIYFWSALTYENGQVFTLNFSGVLQAFDAQTGAPGWTVQLPGQYAFSSAPTAYGGIVYAGGAGSGGTVYAVRETDGTVLWTMGVANGDDSSPAVNETSVYVSYACQQTYDFNRLTGAQLWHYSGACSGGGGRTPALYNGRLYVRDWALGHVILDANTGSLLGTFNANPIPAFAGNLGYFLSGSQLQALNLSNYSVAWSFSGDGSLASAPLVVNGTVYIGSGGNHLYGLDALTGAAVYTGTLPSPVLAPDEQNVSQPLTGFGAGSDTLVVVASSQVVALRHAAPTQTATPTATATATPTAGTPSATPTAGSVTATPTINPADQSVAYQVNPAHDGSQNASGLTPPLRRRWAQNLGGNVSYPLVVGNRVYVLGGSNQGVYALDLATGSTVWGPVPTGGGGAPGLAYDSGQIFVVTFSGLLRALDAQTGAQTWIMQLPGQYAFSSAPSARNGIVYNGGAGSGGTVYANRATDGALLWTMGVANGDDSSPAVSANGVYVSYACQQTYDFNPLTGAQLWHYTSTCSGGGGRTPALYNGRLYVRDWALGHVILDANTGSLLGTFNADPIPAFAGNLGYFLSGSQLQALNLSNYSVAWSFSGDGSLASAPLVVNGTVYIGSGGSHLYGLDSVTGAAVYSTTLPAAVRPSSEGGAWSGLGTGSNTLVVPASSWLVALEHDSGGPTLTPTPPTITPGVPSPTAPAATATTTVTATVCPVQFNDVNINHPFYAYIHCLACRGIVGGYPCGSPGEPCPGVYFRAYNNVTRGQTAKIVSESAGFAEPIPGTQQTFEDVGPDSTFHVWIERLAGRGIIGGYPCGGAFEPCIAPTNRAYFRPNNNVTRGQLSKITSGAAGWTETPTGQTFEDVPPGSTFYLYIERMAGRGVIQGYPCGGVGEPCIAPANRPYFRPNNNATRGQMSKIAAEAFFPNCQALRR